MGWLEGFTLGIALLGAVLGLVNTWHALDLRRVKLKVAPAVALPIGAAPQNINVSVTVTNLSSFPITINEVGFLFRGVRDTDKRAVLIDPLRADGGPWPRRLEPRSSVALYGEAPERVPGRRVRCAYVKTACGVVQRGNSRGLQSLT